MNRFSKPVCELGGGPAGDLEDLRIAGDLGQGVGQAEGVAGQLDGGGVGEVLPLAAHGHLDDAGQQRGDDRKQQGDEDQDGLVPAAALAAGAAAAMATSSTTLNSYGSSALTISWARDMPSTAEAPPK